MNHFRVNLKKERQLEDRYTEIDRENQALLKKMSEAMKKPNPYIDKPDSNKPSSMNRQSRKVDLIRITQENQRMLKAIQGTKPVYNAQTWEESYRKSEVKLRNCASYPIITRMPRQKSSPSVLMSLDGGDRLPSPARSTGSPKRANSEEPDAQKSVLKEGMRIGDKYWLLEMATDGRGLTISAYDGETQTSLELLVKEKQHRQLYRELNGDYSNLAGRLRIADNRLILE